MMNSLRYNVAQYASPIPIVWGTQRVSINVLDGYGYKSSGAGKGGVIGAGKGKGKATVNVAFGFCVGPIDWRGGNAVWANGGVAQRSTIPMNFYGGGDGQAVDPTFASHSPNTPVVNYSGLAYSTATPMTLSGGVLPNFSAEVSGFRVGTAGPSSPVVPDANPAFIVYDMLYDSRVGIGLPGAQADFSVWQNFCQAAMLGFSLLCDKQQPLKSWVEEILLLTSSAGFWSSGRFVVLPYPTSQWDGNGAHYYPNNAPVAFLTDDDFVPWSAGKGSRATGEKDPVLVKRSDVSQLTNWLTIEILLRSYWYDTLVMQPDFDQASIELYGVRTTSSVQAHEVCTQEVGGVVAAMMLSRKLHLRNTYTFRLGWRHMLLEPMDIVAITDSGLGLSQYPVRIIEVVEDDGGVLTMTAEDLTG